MLALLVGQGQTSLSFQSEKTHEQNPQTSAWDYILIDEAQDWPENERDLLFTIFGAEKLILADGMDQLLRQEERCDWTEVSCEKQIVRLAKALRMGSILCDFISAFSSEIGGAWNQERNDDIKNGTITIVEGRYTKDVHDEIMKHHLITGNQPIDALFCANTPGSAGMSLAEAS